MAQNQLSSKRRYHNISQARFIVIINVLNNIKMLKNICRVCGRYAAYKRSIKIFDSPHTLWNVQLLTGLMLQNFDCLPDLICICCQTELREAIRFRDRVIEAQYELMTGLTDEHLQEMPAAYRESIMNCVNNERQHATNTSQFDIESDVDNKNEQETDNETPQSNPAPELEEFITDPGKEEQDNLMEYHIIIDDDTVGEEQEVEEPETQEPHTYDVIDDPPDEQHIEIEVESRENISHLDCILPDRDEEYAVLDRVLNDDIAAAQHPAKKKPGRKPIGSVTYVCDECGNHISGRMAFELHCRRHRGDKQFACSVCPDRFCTSSELKRHMRRHTGERPFACVYCGRCFTDYSTRVKHERTHTNERPFACANCGKAFTTAYILKNHMLTHSGERAFRCELCNKSFIRQTHLVTHCRSKSHKRNLERHVRETNS